MKNKKVIIGKLKSTNTRYIYLIERPEIWPDGKNRPVLYGCYRNKKSALISVRYANADNKLHNGSIKYGKCRVIKFKEVKQ